MGNRIRAYDRQWRLICEAVDASRLEAVPELAD